MTIKEAFEHFDTIDIDFIFVYRCPECGNTFDIVDNELSFYGNKHDFSYHEGLLDLDSEVDRVEWNQFQHVVETDRKKLCYLCSAKKEKGWV